MKSINIISLLTNQWYLPTMIFLNLEKFFKNKCTVLLEIRKNEISRDLLNEHFMNWFEDRWGHRRKYRKYENDRKSFPWYSCSWKDHTIICNRMRENRIENFSSSKSLRFIENIFYVWSISKMNQINDRYDSISDDISCDSSTSFLREFMRQIIVTDQIWLTDMTYTSSIIVFH